MSDHPRWALATIHHLGLTVSDINQSIHFYQNLLGMELIGRRESVTADYVAKQTGYPDVELNVASFQVASSSNQTLEVVQYMSHQGDSQVQATNRPGTSHLCVLVDDLQAAYDDLTQKGVRFKSTPVAITAGPNEGGRVVYLSDPDGYVLELFQPAASITKEHRP